MSVTVPLLLGPKHGEQVTLTEPLPQKLRFPVITSANPLEMTIEEYEAAGIRERQQMHIYVLKRRQISDEQTMLSYFWEGTEQ